MYGLHWKMWSLSRLGHQTQTAVVLSYAITAYPSGIIARVAYINCKQAYGYYHKQVAVTAAVIYPYCERKTLCP